MEEWRDIKGYEGKYQVSNLGRIKSLNYRGTHKHEIMKPRKTTVGYEMITLTKNGIPSQFLIHRLVAEAFIPNPNNLPCVNHKIDDYEHRSDNRVENLEWCTYRYNNTYGNKISKFIKSRTGKCKGNKHPFAKKVKCLNNNMVFDTVTEAAKWGNATASTISKQIKGQRKTAGKHPMTGDKLKWEYMEENNV